MDLHLTKCTEEQKQAILRSVNSNDAHLQEHVKIIQNWVKTQPHIPEMPESIVIEKFLLINKFNMENVKKRLSFYYIIREMIPDVFLVHPKHPELINCMKTFDYLVLPHLTPDLGRILIFRINDEMGDEFDPILYVAYTILVTEIRLREDYRLRDVFLYDLQNIKFSHFSKLSPLVIKKITIILKKLYNDTDLYINLINVAPYAHSFMNIIKNMYPAKVQERFMIHDNLESLYKNIPKENLPVEYGGNFGTIDQIRDMWTKKIEEYDSLFTRLRSLKVDQDLLPENLKIDDNFGVHGNFKKLNVD